jgi:rare lipoprotein A (RlpA)-like double-psi beta-barrel protein
MKTGRNRPGRKDQARRERATGTRPQRAARWLSVLLACATIALPAAAYGAMGGVSSVTSSQAGTGAGLTFSSPMRPAGATWYGPGLYGNRTACGQVLRPGTIGVAHRSLPCGTAVKFAYRGRQIVTTVIDRGPYSDGNAWDLTNGARRALRFEGADRVLYAVSLRHAAERR